jgi:deoxyadenosine/deoxycytidine kinase
MSKCLGIITVEGSVGAGKTTVLEIIKEKTYPGFDFICCPEPVDEWSRLPGNTILQNDFGVLQKYKIQPPLKAFYTQGLSQKEKDVVIAFQNYALMTRYFALKKTIQENLDRSRPFIIVGERLIYADLHVFMRALIDEGLVDINSASMYGDVWNLANMDFEQFKIGIIAVEASVDNCGLRISKRKRAGEEEITPAYLSKIQNYHDDMYRFLEDRPVEKISWNQDGVDESARKKVLDTLDEIIVFIKATNS